MDIEDLKKAREAELKVLADIDAAIVERGGSVDGNGNGTDKDPVNAATREQQLAETFMRMSTAEQMKLHDEQHEVWEQMLDAVRKNGERQLFTRKV